MKLSALMGSSVLLAGPPGSGKSTWAKGLYHLLPNPTFEEKAALRKMSMAFHHSLTWRPLIAPHHTIPVMSMVGGGVPLFSGEIAKAHLGMLLLDELLEFHPRVLEALREPLESKKLTIARRGESLEWSADFQFVATTNLCPCGRMVPGRPSHCGYSLRRCRSTWERLSGPILDRFDLVFFTSEWGSRPREVLLSSLVDEMADLRELALRIPEEAPPEVLTKGVQSLRRTRAMSRAARALAAMDGWPKIQPGHWLTAYDLTQKPQEALRQLFA
jgi:magnesium chelatase family protein